MTNATLATRAAAGLSAALISAMSLVACGGEDESAADDPVEQATEPAAETTEEPSRDSAREPKRRTKKPAGDRKAKASDERETEESTNRDEAPEPMTEPAAMSADEFCEAYTQEEIFAEADTPAGARKASKHLGELAEEAPKRVRDDVELLAELYGEIAKAKGDPDKIAAIDTSGLEETSKHLKRWERKHC